MFRISQCGIPNAALVYGDDSSVHEMHPGSLSTDLDVVDSRKTVRLRPKADAAHSPKSSLARCDVASLAMSSQMNEAQL